jgi:hypothetical protein
MTVKVNAALLPFMPIKTIMVGIFEALISLWIFYNLLYQV